MWTTDVLAQFYPAMCVRFHQPCNRIDIWDGEGEASFIKDNVDLVHNNFRFWLNLEPLSRPEDINFEFDYYITSSPPGMVSFRRDWLKVHGFPNKPVIHSLDKGLTMRQLGLDLLIDDNPKTLDKVASQGFHVIQFIPPYMSVERGDLNPIRHLSQVKEIIKNLR